MKTNFPNAVEANVGLASCGRNTSGVVADLYFYHLELGDYRVNFARGSFVSQPQQEPW